MEIAMTDFANIAERYIAMWNETDAERRRDIIARLWADNGRYVDPLMRGDGPSGIDAMVQGVQQRFPGFRFTLVGKVDGHNDRLRFGWELGDGINPAPVAGIDVGVVAPDGRLQSITGFIDRMPAAA
jgi:hypothetical protein